MVCVIPPSVSFSRSCRSERSPKVGNTEPIETFYHFLLSDFWTNESQKQKWCTNYFEMLHRKIYNGPTTIIDDPNLNPIFMFICINEHQIINLTSWNYSISFSTHIQIKSYEYSIWPHTCNIKIWHWSAFLTHNYFWTHLTQIIHPSHWHFDVILIHDLQFSCY